jgi:hypothetical protein
MMLAMVVEAHTKAAMVMEAQVKAAMVIKGTCDVNGM